MVEHPLAPALRPKCGGPGIPLFDGECYVEWLSKVSLVCPTAVEDQSWGAIKNLYR